METTSWTPDAQDQTIAQRQLHFQRPISLRQSIQFDESPGFSRDGLLVSTIYRSFPQFALVIWEGRIGNPPRLAECSGTLLARSLMFNQLPPLLVNDAMAYWLGYSSWLPLLR